MRTNRRASWCVMPRRVRAGTLLSSRAVTFMRPGMTPDPTGRYARRMGRLMLALTVVMGGVGLFFVAMGIRHWVRADASAGWPVVPGVITESRVVTRNTAKGGRSVRPVVTYRYEVDGVRHESSTLDFRVRGWGAPAAAETAARFPVGAAVTVRHSPDDPDVACLVPGADAWNALPVGVGIFAMAFCAIFAMLVRRAAWGRA